jgi:uncharacterized protein YcbK (DUF882 family)
VLLSANVTLESLVKSHTATRLHLDNTPSTVTITALSALCEHILEPIVAHYKGSLIINSGYRCYELNKAIGGAKRSQHILGEAADIEIVGVSNQALYDWIKANLIFDQLILECHKPHIPTSGWVHGSFSLIRNRQQALAIG